MNQFKLVKNVINLTHVYPDYFNDVEIVPGKGIKIVGGYVKPKDVMLAYHKTKIIKRNRDIIEINKGTAMKFKDITMSPNGICDIVVETNNIRGTLRNARHVCIPEHFNSLLFVDGLLDKNQIRELQVKSKEEKIQIFLASRRYEQIVHFEGKLLKDINQECFLYNTPGQGTIVKNRIDNHRRYDMYFHSSWWKSEVLLNPENNDKYCINRSPTVRLVSNYMASMAVSN